MRIVTVQETTGLRGGRERAHLAQLSMLAAAGHDIVVVAREHMEAEQWAAVGEVVEWAGRWAKPLRSSPRKSMSEVVKLARQLRRFRPDVVYVPARLLMFVGALACVGGRAGLVVHMHDPVRPLDRFDRWAMRRACRIIGVSAQSEAGWRSVGGDGRWRVIPTGVDLRHLRPAGGDDRLAARNKLGVDDGPWVAFVGRDARGKGLGVLRAALSEGCSDAGLLIAGAGRVEPEASAAERVRAVGWVDPLLAYWASDVVAVPSDEFDSFPLVPLEAMACGVPVVVTDVAAGYESLPADLHDLVVPAGDAKALAEVLERLLSSDDARRRIGSRLRQHAEQNFDSASREAEVANVLAGCSREG